MELIQKLPRTIWWFAGMLLLVVAVLVVVWFIRSGRPSLPPGLVEKREKVTRILAERERTPDVDIRPLIDLEARRNFKGAVALMEQALAANTRQEEFNAALIKASGELATLAVSVEPDELGAKAIGAFGALSRLAGAERRYYQNRRTLYEVTRGYYLDLTAGLQPPVPDRLADLVDAVNAELEKAKAAHNEFAAAISAFDQAAVGQDHSSK